MRTGGKGKEEGIMGEGPLEGFLQRARFGVEERAGLGEALFVWRVVQRIGGMGGKYEPWSIRILSGVRFRL